ncbi:chondroitin AC/alginate lyase [Cytidiella melzeri]|nr:chondroitin AC/alginate lyase [Cytidiella melzeri]
MATRYHNANTPYGSGDPYYNESSGYITPMPLKKKTSNWIKFGVPVLIAVIVAAVVGGVVGSRHHSSSSSNVSGGSSGSSGDQAAAASSAASVQNALGLYPTSTNSLYLIPIYPSTTNTAAFTTPTIHTTSDTSLGWPQDPFQPSNPSPTNVRPDRPRLIAPAYKWQALPQLIASNPYLRDWNDTIFGNATQYYNLPPVQYFMDGSSGILDNCRYVKERVKAWGYAYRMTNDTRWVDRTVQELTWVAGSNFGPDNSTKWNPSHFLDTAEMTAAFAIAYDWMYDALTSDQKTTLRQNMIDYGLSQGAHAYANSVSGDFSGWWAAPTTQGNWNCVCNSGMTLGALAILGDDTTGSAEQILGLSIPNALAGCVNAVSSDGTWSETANYWYFGTTGHAEMSSALMTATGSDMQLLTSNKNFALTGNYHMSVFGPGSLFSYGDHGPNKYSTTANAMFLYGDYYKKPQYILFQRDQFDASSDPWSMFWYNPLVAGAFWDGMPLDNFFDNSTDQWAAMRSSWTDESAMYVAIKAGELQGHQTHNDLDCGDFVLDAMGHRWAGELGSADYNSPGYFNSDAQDAERWLYYRKRTEGQNTILVNQANQNVNAMPTVQHGSTGEAQGSSTVYDVPSGSTAYWTADLTSAYNDTTSFKRGIRMINGRKQVLLQDDITASQPIMWRMHTNATVNVDPSGTSATLTIGNDTLVMQVLNPTSGVTISVGSATRFPNDPPLPDGVSDPLNPGVFVVSISLDPGTYSLQVLFNPQWPGMQSSDFKQPPSVAIDSWTLTSHN